MVVIHEAVMMISQVTEIQSRQAVWSEAQLFGECAV